MTSFLMCLSANIALVSHFYQHTVGSYCTLHRINAIFCYAICIVCWCSWMLLNVVVVFTCLQDMFPAFDLHNVHLPSFKVFKFFLNLSFFIQCVPIISWMILFLLNAVISSFLNISLKFPYICKILQLILVIFGRTRLYVITRVILSDFCLVSFSIIISILLSRLILSRYLLINDGWYPCFMKLLFISLRLLFQSTWFELICLI